MIATRGTCKPYLQVGLERGASTSLAPGVQKSCPRFCKPTFPYSLDEIKPLLDEIKPLLDEIKPLLDEFGSHARIRTSVHAVKVRCPTS